MSERKFLCPACGQKISCDTTMAGLQVQCPACQKEITVPAMPRAVMAVQAPVRAAAEQPATTVSSPSASAAGSFVPEVPKETRLSVAKHEASTATTMDAAPTPPRPPIPVPMAARPSRAQTSDDGKKKKRLLTTAVLIIAVGAGAYFALPTLFGTEEDASGKGKTAEKAAPSSPDTAAQTPPSETTVSSLEARSAAPPVWTLDLKSVAIPDGRANGTIGGKAFSAETARLDPVGQMHLLTLRQGGSTYADREILVYLRLKPGETLEGKTWSVDPAVKTGNPQIVKRWLNDPQAPPLSKSFPAGYAMKLEFGKPQGSEVPGKIFVALPDAEKTVVGGTFMARIGSGARTATPATVPAVNRR